MALPAGRYGVTKNQLLKIKKLPMNTIKLIEELAEKYDLLGTAAFKNSTSVVTDSTDLVESGAVYDVVKGSVGWVASRNIAPITLDVIKESNIRGTWNGNAYTDRGVTYTVNDDLSISMSGTATGGNSSIALLPSTTPIAFLDVGSYFMSGCPQGGSVETYYLNYAPRPTGSHIRDTGDGLLINNTTANQGYNIYFIALEGADVTGKVLKAQLEKGTSASPYYPYHASVDESKCDNSVIAPVENDTTASQAYSAGRGFMHNGQFRVAKSGGIASGATISDSNSEVKTVEDCLIGVYKHQINDLSALSWSSQTNFKNTTVNLDSVLPSGKKIVGITASESWSTDLSVLPLLSINTSQRGVQLLIPPSATPTGKLGLMVLYV